MSKNAWIDCSDYVRVLMMPIILDVWHGFEYASGIKYARVLSMLQCSYDYNNIIIVTVVLLELSSTRFIHWGALKLTILSFFLKFGFHYGLTWDNMR